MSCPVKTLYWPQVVVQGTQRSYATTTCAGPSPPPQVHNPTKQYTYRDVERTLCNDARWKALAETLREKLFQKHMEDLMDRRTSQFMELLQATAEIQINSSYKDLEPVLKKDRRCSVAGRGWRACPR